MRETDPEAVRQIIRDWNRDVAADEEARQRKLAQDRTETKFTWMMVLLLALLAAAAMLLLFLLHHNDCGVSAGCRRII